MTSNNNELAGRVIAGCELIRELGRGTNGIVYLAKHKQLNRQVACKVISPDLQEYQEFLDNLFAEAVNAAKLSHPNIIQALDAGDSEGIKYFMMEYVEGSTLEYLRTNTPEVISTEFLLNISMQLAVAMDFAWTNHQMTHGDIKPGNIMITAQNNILKIGDLGLARSSNGATGDPADVMVTPLYAAPEIILQQQNSTDPRSDIYSFGVMFYELACGTAPFSGSLDDILHSHVNITPQPLHSMNPDLDKELANFIDTMLAKNPEHRPADWKAVYAALQTVHKRLFPQLRAPELSTASGGNTTIQGNRIISSSWSAENKNVKPFWEKYPWLMPAVLILLILLAMFSIPFSLGLF